LAPLATGALFFGLEKEGKGRMKDKAIQKGTEMAKQTVLFRPTTAASWSIASAFPAGFNIIS
jgi:hypothetical protein